MNKTFEIIILCFFLNSCTTYLTTSKTVKENQTIESKNQFLNGRYYNSISYYDDFWTTITDKKQSTDSLKNLRNEILELKALSNNLLLAKLFDNNTLIDSIHIVGTFKDSTFIFKRKRNISMFFPIFWTYDTDDFKLKLDKDNNLCLNRNGKSFVFVTLAPMMAADGSFEKKFIRWK